MSKLELKGINKSFGSSLIVNNLDLEIQDGEFLTILGPSGCGKTTTLRMIAGFETPDSGQVLLNKQDITQLPPYKRNVNTVFQNYALFPHLNVAENIAFGLHQKKLSKAEMNKRVDEMLELVQMQAFKTRKPFEMSGGQQQRVAIARAIAPDPEILLLDEPVSGIDELHRHLVARVIGVPSAITVIRHTEKLDLMITPEELARNHQRN